MKAAHDVAPERHTKPFLDHLEDLRHALLRCLAVLAAAVVLAFPFAPRILVLLKRPLLGVVPDPDRFLQSLEVSGAFSVSLAVAFWSGLLVSAPFLCYFIGAFVFPGLTRREQRVILRAAGLAGLLFLAGVAIGYRWTLPVALNVMLGLHRWMGIVALWTVSSYVTFALQLLLGFGLVFELPVLLLILGVLGLVSSRQLRRARRVAILAAVVLGAILTPGPDVFSQVLMALPLILLYELCVWLVWAAERRRGREEGP